MIDPAAKALGVCAKWMKPCEVSQLGPRVYLDLKSTQDNGLHHNNLRLGMLQVQVGVGRVPTRLELPEEGMFQVAPGEQRSRDGMDFWRPSRQSGSMWAKVNSQSYHGIYFWILYYHYASGWFRCGRPCPVCCWQGAVHVGKRAEARGEPRRALPSTSTSMALFVASLQSAFAAL